MRLPLSGTSMKVCLGSNPATTYVTGCRWDGSAPLITMGFAPHSKSRAPANRYAPTAFSATVNGSAAGVGVRPAIHSFHSASVTAAADGFDAAGRLSGSWAVTDGARIAM